MGGTIKGRRFRGMSRALRNVTQGKEKDGARPLTRYTSLHGGKTLFGEGGYACGMEQSAHLLLVDDDKEIRELVTGFLQKHGYRVTAAADGKQMDKALESGLFDLAILDLMLPGEDGLSICRRLNADERRLPIIMLTAMGEDMDRIVGLEMGADDYIAKPFNPRELLARIKAVLRRSAPAETPGGETIFGFEGWVLDTGRRTLTDPEGALVELTAGEFDLLAAFLERPRRVLNRDQLLDITRGRMASPFDRSIDVQLSRLRKKIEPDHKNPAFIKTIRGGGYMLTAEVVRH